MSEEIKGEIYKQILAKMNNDYKDTDEFFDMMSAVVGVLDEVKSEIPEVDGDHFYYANGEQKAVELFKKWFNAKDKP